MAEHIITYGGTYFYPTEPDPEAIHITDIAHALPMICRGNGHVHTFFSVGQHCLFCAREAEARGLSDRVILGCLLHDASECYMSDVPRPFKASLPEYRESEEKLLDMVYTKYLGSPLTDEEKEEMKRIDDDLLYFDLTQLLHDPGVKGPAPELARAISYDVLPFEEVTRQYLEIFYTYEKRVMGNLDDFKKL